jgi:flagellar basal body rod protein FlgG
MPRAAVAGLALLLGGCLPPPMPPPPARTVILETGNVLDWAIDGPGYFVLTHPELGRTVYTRTGGFTIDGNGLLATRTRPSWQLSPLIIVNPDRLGATRLSPDGALLVPDDAKADLTPTAILAGPIGLCADCSPIPTGWKVLGLLTIAVFERPETLVKRPDGFWEAPSDAGRRIVTPSARAATASDLPARPGRLVQGILETTSAASLPTFPLPIPLGRGSGL